MEHANLVQLAYMAEADIEPAPFGGVIVDGTGTISLYNAYESALANLPADRVIGKNFFLDVAPCTAVAAFEGRFLEFVASEEPVSDQFAYFFPFKHGSANVLVTFVKRSDPDSYLIVIERVERERIAALEDFYSPIVGEPLDTRDD